MAAVLIVVAPVVATRLATGAGSQVTARMLADLGGLLLVFVAGLYDDHHAGPHRGLRGHLLELARGRVTAGTIKLFAAVGAGVLIAGPSGHGTVRAILGVLVMAGCANLWNLLDVRPGRAIKCFLPVIIALVFMIPAGDFPPLAVVTLVSAVAALWPDLREVAMLGDSGSNLLGLVAGIGLFRLHSLVALAVALAAILVLHLLAETVSLSTIIEATPPLRWFDRLGRLDNAPEEDSPRPSL
jgi:UDP-N-acetylmuramyl pentapeptide phosphotransferase/UDP-N-acetylglucosamine-1-phosphate transferase